MPFLDREGDPVPQAKLINRNLAGFWLWLVVTVWVLAWFCFQSVVTVREHCSSEPHATYKRGDWMRANIPPGKLFFNTDWDDFFQGSSITMKTHYYVSVLDPTYLFDKNPDLSRSVRAALTLGKEEDPGPQFAIVRWRVMCSPIIHITTSYKRKESGWFEKFVFEGSACTIMRIRDGRPWRPAKRRNPHWSGSGRKHPVNPEQ